VPQFPVFHIPMNIQPDDACEYCDVKSWSISIVDTSPRFDLFTCQKCPNYRGASICKNCGMTSYWQVEPDATYEEPEEDDHEKGTAKK
jgi:hypothetical protein